MIKEDEIIEGCLKGKKKYQELLYKRFASVMMGVCLRYFKNRPEAEDCLQEGFIRVFRFLNTYKGDGSLEGWMRKIIVNTALNIYKANMKYRDVEDIENVKDAKTEPNIDSLSTDEILKHIQNLPDGYRMVLNLYAIEGYSHKEIAEMLNISEGTSYSQLSRAKNLLEQKINEANKIKKVSEYTDL